MRGTQSQIFGILRLLTCNLVTNQIRLKGSATSYNDMYSAAVLNNSTSSKYSMDEEQSVCVFWVYERAVWVFV
jgi:hypothetical protein